jgi:hypothetical protein
MGTLVAALGSFSLTILGSAVLLIGMLDSPQITMMNSGGGDVGILSGPSQFASGPLA